MLVDCIHSLDWAFYVPDLSNLFTGSTMNALDVYLKYTADVVPQYKYCVVYLSTNIAPCLSSTNCLLTLLHIW